MKLCTYQLNNGLCGEPSPESRCSEHPYPERTKASRQSRGYDEAWAKLSKRARALQPWCSVCGTTEDLTGDHLRWPARTLRDVDVLCRSHNAKKGSPKADPRGEGLDDSVAHPGGKAFDFTQLMQTHVSGGGLGG